MPSYVVTGASRGIGLEFVRQLGAVPENIVIALVRNKASADRLTPLEGGNVYVLQADVTDYKALKVAAVTAAEVTGGTLDVLINNAAVLAGDNDWRNLTDFEGEEELLEQEFDKAFKVNVVGVVHSTNAFLPLLRKGQTKKVITISSGGGEREFVMKTNLTGMTAYGPSKAAVNMVMAKYAVQLRDAGFIFVSLRPGLVDTSATAVGEMSAKNMEWIKDFMDNFKKTSPSFPGMISPTESVTRQLKKIAEATTKDTGSIM